MRTKQYTIFTWKSTLSTPCCAVLTNVRLAYGVRLNVDVSEKSGFMGQPQSTLTKELYDATDRDFAYAQPK